MIVVPQNPEQAEAMAKFLHDTAGINPSAQLTMIGWVADGKLQMAVGLDSFIGKTCAIHVGMAKDWNYTPKEMLKVVFDFAFNTAQREMLIGIVNSKNENAMKYDLHLGFKVEHTIPGMHDDGGDLVILSMKKADCKYLEMKEKAA